VFAFMYAFMPNTRVRLRAALIGGLFGGVVWAASGVIFTSFVASNRSCRSAQRSLRPAA